MGKDFQKWMGEKQRLENSRERRFFHERELWWCALGTNLGHEMDGTGKDFDRPVVVVKKFNLDVCLVIPLTSRTKSGKYYMHIGKVAGVEACAVLSQIRFVDQKRMANKIGVLERTIYEHLLEAVQKVNFPSSKGTDSKV